MNTCAITFEQASLQQRNMQFRRKRWIQAVSAAGGGATPKPNKHSLVNLASLIALLILLGAVPVFASSTQQSMQLNGGILSWTDTTTIGNCGANNTFTQDSLTNFVFSYTYASTYHPGENIPISVNLGGNAAYISRSIGQPYCPPNGPQPANGLPLLDVGQFYRIWFTPGINGTSSATMESFATGGTAPKYIVLSVIYAPPNPGPTSSFGHSSVNYTNTTALGTNTTWSSSFQNGYSYSTSASFLGIGLSGGASWMQETDDSTSISLNKSSSDSDIFSGIQPTNTVGLNHDDDVIQLWINPALLCTSEEKWNVLPIPAAAQCLIYDPMGLPGDLDDPLMDVVQLPVGELNGDYSLESLNPDTYQILESHGITDADYQTILSADPYASCSGSITCVQAIGANSTRFDLVTSVNPPIDFSNNGNSRVYQAVYAATSSQGQGASTSFSITNTLSGSESFLGTMKEILKSTQTWTDKWSEMTSMTVGQTATITVNQPGSTSGYDGPTQFEVYKDSIYGTFMFYPTQ